MTSKTRLKTCEEHCQLQASREDIATQSFTQTSSSSSSSRSRALSAAAHAREQQESIVDDHVQMEEDDAEIGLQLLRAAALTDRLGRHTAGFRNPTIDEALQKLEEVHGALADAVERRNSRSHAWSDEANDGQSQRAARGHRSSHASHELQDCEQRLQLMEEELNEVRREFQEQKERHRAQASCRSTDTCVVCLQEPAAYAAVPCGHLALCGGCLDSCSSPAGRRCVTCRQPCEAFLHIFRP